MVQPVTRHGRRRGTTLVELLVSLVLVTLLVGIGSMSTRRVLAVQARTARDDARHAALTDALLTLSRQAASADPLMGDLRVARDTALELLHDIGMTTVCRTAGDTLVVTSGADTLPWSATLPRLVTTDDFVRIWHDADARWIARRVLAATPASGPCGDSSLAWPDRGTQQLLLDSTTAGMRPGVVVRVLQHERWSMVRGADGNWSLSLATFDATRNTMSSPQPLLSPLAAPSAPSGPGLAVRAIDAQGRTLPDTALAQTRALMLTLRLATSARQHATTDSIRINVGIH